MLDGIVVKPLKRHFDERGSFAEVMRTDWQDLLGRDKIVQANLSASYPGVVRAWHRHVRGQVDYLVVLGGTLKICVFDDVSGELDEIISTDQEPKLVRVPGHYWHGFKVLGDEKALLLYFTTRLYDHENPDEERRPWNDPAIRPKSINGGADDPRSGKPWDWNLPPHR